MEQLTTGENKRQFEEWYLKDFRGYKDPRHRSVFEERELNLFYGYHFEMQIGVYLAYYDSLGIRIRVNLNSISNDHVQKSHKEDWGYFINQSNKNRGYNTRNEVYQEAFKQANIIINNG